MKKLVAIILLAVVSNFVQAQGVNFFKGTFEEALAKAKAENKILFVDCFATWCGPCKAMDAKVFPDSSVGAYANEKFVNYKLEVELPENKTIAREYKITSMPTYLFFSTDSKVVSRRTGAIGVEDFMRAMKIATGEALSLSQMYDKLGGDKNADPALTREFLLLVPREASGLPKEEKPKWEARINSTFDKYIKSRPLDMLINKEDFMIITTFNRVSKGNELFKFMCDNYDKYKEAFGDITPAKYIIPTHVNLMTGMAKKGDKDYLVELERLNGDLKNVYGEIKAATSMDIYSAQKHSLDAAYTIYSKKDVTKYVELMDKYFAEIGTEMNSSDYEKAAGDLYTAMSGRLPKKGYTKCVEWLTKAMEYDLTEKKQIRLLTMLGDCHKSLNNIDQAKGVFNRAFILAMQTNDLRMQHMIKSALAKINSL